MKRLLPSLILLAALILGGAVQVQPIQSGFAYEGQPPTPDQDGPDPEEVAVTRWINPSGEGPLTFAEWQADHPYQPFHSTELSQVASAPSSGKSASQPALLLLVESNLYTRIEPEITRYLADLQNEGVMAYWATPTGGSPKNIRALLHTAWLENGIDGALLVGDFPVPWFEMDDDFNGRAEFPVDLYYMDLDGAWRDTDHDGMFEAHTGGAGDIDLEIYLGRLTASPLSTSSLETETILLRNYFDRNHAYRTQSFYHWLEINTTGMPLYLADDGFQQVTLPFPVTFFGKTYTTAYISANGFLSFDAGFSNAKNACLPNPGAPNAAIYAWWDDLRPASAGGAGTVYYHLVDEDTFVIEWDHVQRGSSAETVTFELSLYRTGTVVAQYKSVSGLDSATIGLENGSGTNTVEYACNGSGGGIESGQLLVFSPLDSYSHAFGSMDWSEINATGTLLSLADDGSVEVGLPFPFTFYANTYTSVFVNANGFLSFDQGFPDFANTCLPNVSQPDNAIYAWWENLLPKSGGGLGKIYYKQLDSDTFVVEWDRVRRFDSGDLETFEILLRRDGSITIQYKSVNSISSPTAGLESPNSSRPLAYACDGYVGYPIFSGLALHFSPLHFGSYRPYGLAYIDNDWSYWYGDLDGHYLQLLYGEDVDHIWAVSPIDETTRNDYLAHLGSSPQLVHVMSHGSSGWHGFSEDSGSGWISSTDVEIFNPPAQFYNLFVCSGARYIESDYIGGKYILDPYDGAAMPVASTAGLAAVGSTKTGSMLSFENFYTPLSLGKNFGQAYHTWFNQVALDGFDLYERRWHYGMALLGDPSLRLRNPSPTLTALDPQQAAAGGEGFTLTVNGQDFVFGAVVRWNGEDLGTVFISPVELKAQVLPDAIASVGPAEITILNPAPGGGLAGPLIFTIVNPTPTLSALDPDSAVTGSPGFLLTVDGLNFVPGSVVRWNGLDLETDFTSSTLLEAVVPSTYIVEAGSASITVFNPEPGGGLSSARSFAIYHPVPLLVNLNPASIIAGSSVFTLAVHGENFVAGALVRWNGADLETTFMDSNHLAAIVPASKIAIAGEASITVLNPTPTSGDSNPLTFTTIPWSITYFPLVQR